MVSPRGQLDYADQFEQKMIKVIKCYFNHSMGFKDKQYLFVEYYIEDKVWEISVRWTES